MATQKIWKAGDKVKLPSGGATMTVRYQGPRMGNSGDVIVVCQWMNKDDNLQQAEFDPNQLVAAK